MVTFNFLPLIGEPVEFVRLRVILNGLLISTVPISSMVILVCCL